MVFQKVEITESRDRFGRLREDVKIRQGLLGMEKYEIEEAYRDILPNGDTSYVYHVKTGHLGSHRHYTVRTMESQGMTTVTDVIEGKKTFW